MLRFLGLTATWGTVEWSVSLSLEGMARAVSCLMVIFSRLQLDDLGSEDNRAWGWSVDRTDKVIHHLST